MSGPLCGSRGLRRWAVAGLVALALSGCGAARTGETADNVRPPAAGTPDQPGEVQGIYRSIGNAVLQLRGNGDLVLIIPAGGGPDSGRFTLQSGRLEVQTSNCGEAVGSYEMVVSGEQEAGKATLQITAVSDECADRRRDLTRDPWVYSNS